VAATHRVLLIGKHDNLGERLESGLATQDCDFDYAAGSADALRRLRRTPYDAVITDPATSIEEDLALLAEIQAMRPGVRAIVLAPSSTPEEIIAALRARVFVCMTAPFDPDKIAEYAARAAITTDALVGIEVLSAHRNWVSLRMNCYALTAERLIEFLKELRSELPEPLREELMMAFREILMNAIEHGAEAHGSKVIDVAAVQTARAVVFYVHDPGAGFRWEIKNAAGPSGPLHAHETHVAVRADGGSSQQRFAGLKNRGIIDELICSEVGNEILLIKHTA
jgi:ActR/RegA family two-component response regulator